MNTILTNSVILAILFIILVVTGVWLRIKGEPYNNVIINLHKLSTLGMIALLVLVTIQHTRIMEFNGIGLILVIFSTIFIILALITGALLSFENTARVFLKMFHRLASVLAFIMIPLIWYLCH